VKVPFKKISDIFRDKNSGPLEFVKFIVDNQDIFSWIGRVLHNLFQITSSEGNFFF